MSFRPVRFVCFFADRLIAFLKWWSLFLLVANLRFLKANEGDLSTVQNLVIPQFNEDGHLSWELHASQVTSKDSDTFLTTNPILYMFTDQIIELTAKSSAGVFLLESGQANGAGFFDVVGSGFRAKGNDWQWINSVGKGRNQMIFKQYGKVIFSSGLGGFFAHDLGGEDSRCATGDEDSPQGEEKNATIPTVAQADYLEFVSTQKNSHLFSLDGNVSIEGDNLFLTCDNIEVLFVKDGNGSNSEIGKISTMDAKGNVVLRQGGRVSYADMMALDVKLGTVLLTGRARVVDDEWGEARGESIVLEKGNRRARVLGGKNTRPRLELPPLPDFGFRKKVKKKTQ